MSRPCAIVHLGWLLVPKSFGLDATKEMERIGLSYTDISRKTGIPMHHVCTTLRGHRQPRWRDIAVIAAALGLIEFYDPPARRGILRQFWHFTRLTRLIIFNGIAAIASLLGIYGFFRG